MAKAKTTRPCSNDILECINELKKEVNRLEKEEEYQKTADETFIVYQSFIKAGFNEEQSFDLLKIMIDKAIVR